MLPLFISSLTTSAAFLAFFLAESVMGDIVGPLFIVITIALLSSWLLSMTLIPLLVVALARPKASESESRVMGIIRSAYTPFLKLALRFRAVVVIAVVVLFVVVMNSAWSLAIQPKFPWVGFRARRVDVAVGEAFVSLPDFVSSGSKGRLRLPSFVRRQMGRTSVAVQSSTRGSHRLES